MKKTVLTFLCFYLCGFFILAGAIFYVFKTHAGDDLSEIHTKNITKKLEYASERGFGSDRLDVYSFSLTAEESLAGFKDLDDFYQNKSAHYFLNLLNDTAHLEEKEAQTKKDLSKAVKILENNTDTQYLYYEKENTSKMYIYSKSSNKGYCFVLVY